MHKLSGLFKKHTQSLAWQILWMNFCLGKVMDLLHNSLISQLIEQYYYIRGSKESSEFEGQILIGP